MSVCERKLGGGGGGGGSFTLVHKMYCATSRAPQARSPASEINNIDFLYSAERDVAPW